VISIRTSNFITILLLVFFLSSQSLVLCTIGDSKEKTIHLQSSNIDINSVFIPDIIIPDNYTTIQEGINNSNPGYKILVRSGIYKENLVINKENLKIVGENKDTTIIDGNKKTHAISIISPNITIQGFTIKNGWNKNEYLWDLSGIKINASNVKIIGNIITSNRLGIITFTKTYNHTIQDNKFIDDGLLFGNYVYNNHMTIEDFIHTVENNTVNGKTLVYIKNQKDFTVNSDAGQVILVNCTNATVKNLNIKNTDFSIILAGCKNCLIENNTIDETDGELILFLSENNTIRKNTISNGLHGICLDYGSKNNIVQENTVIKNWVGISSITKTSNNIIEKNIIYRNDLGIEISTYYLPFECHNNTIVGNRIFGSKTAVKINHGSHNHKFKYNTIVFSIHGLKIDNSNNITIKNNNFNLNLLFDAYFIDSNDLVWYNNYWNRPKFLPKIIPGFKTIGKISSPWVNIDLKPAKLPCSY